MKAMVGFSLPKKKIQNQQEKNWRQNMQMKPWYPKVVFGGYSATQLCKSSTLLGKTDEGCAEKKSNGLTGCFRKLWMLSGATCPVKSLIAT